jgi:hypothetical protein
MGTFFSPSLTRVLDNKELDEYDVFHAKAPTQSRLQNGYEVHNIHLICLGLNMVGN